MHITDYCQDLWGRNSQTYGIMLVETHWVCRIQTAAMDVSLLSDC